MKRLFAFLLLCGVVAMCASPAMATVDSTLLFDTAIPDADFVAVLNVVDNEFYTTSLTQAAGIIDTVGTYATGANSLSLTLDNGGQTEIKASEIRAIVFKDDAALPATIEKLATYFPNLVAIGFITSGTQGNTTKMDLTDCTKLSTILTVTAGTGFAEADLGKTTGLAEFTQLETLDVRSTDIASLTLTDAVALTSVNAAGCKKLTAATMADFTNDATVNLSGCENLAAVTGATFSANKTLTLNLSKCTSLKTLTWQTSTADAAIALNVSDCTALAAITRTGAQDKLTALNANGCTSLETVTLVAADVTGLKTLDLGGCTALTGIGTAVDAGAALGGATALTELNLNGCSKLTAVTLATGTTAATLLTSIDLTGCSELTDVVMATHDDDAACTSLEKLDVSGCAKLTTLTLADGDATAGGEGAACVKLSSLKLNKALST